MTEQKWTARGLVVVLSVVSRADCPRFSAPPRSANRNSETATGDYHPFLRLPAVGGPPTATQAGEVAAIRATHPVGQLRVCAF